jgi:hypothetical protein
LVSGRKRNVYSKATRETLPNTHPMPKWMCSIIYGMMKFVKNAQMTFHAVPMDCVFSRTAPFGISAPKRYGIEAPPA